MFHDRTALHFSVSAITTYLYGLEHTAYRDHRGNLSVVPREVAEHEHDGKVIESGLFAQQGSEELSAVIFSNTSTVSQFQRIGTELGFGDDNVRVMHAGLAFDPTPTPRNRASSPTRSRPASAAKPSPSASTSCTTPGRASPFGPNPSRERSTCTWYKTARSFRRGPTSSHSARTRSSTGSVSPAITAQGLRGTRKAAARRHLPRPWNRRALGCASSSTARSAGKDFLPSHYGVPMEQAPPVPIPPVAMPGLAERNQGTTRSITGTGSSSISPGRLNVAQGHELLGPCRDCDGHWAREIVRGQKPLTCPVCKREGPPGD